MYGCLLPTEFLCGEVLLPLPSEGEVAFILLGAVFEAIRVLNIKQNRLYSEKRSRLLLEGIGRGEECVIFVGEVGRGGGVELFISEVSPILI